ncbi:MAG: radical SAM family heme chaperone HemW [bacterium]
MLRNPLCQSKSSDVNKNIPLDKSPASIILYPVANKEVDQQEIWSQQRSRKKLGNGIGLYLHIPFCKSLCTFCPFTKYIWEKDKETDYIKALKREIDLYTNLPLVKGNDISTIYFGGGTPTSLSTNSLVELLDYIKEKFKIIQQPEITVETHPLTVSEDKLAKIKDKGVNRITMGVQSFSDNLLKILGCKHNKKQSVSAIKTLKDIGFDSFGLDIFYRIPTQTMYDWEESLDIVTEFEPDHISCYNLGVFPGTLLHKKIINGEISKQPDLTVMVEMYKRARIYLEKHGYQEYTISNYMKGGKSSHYLKLTLEAPQGQYLGLGLSSFEYANDFYSHKVSSLNEYIDMIEKNIIPYSKGVYISKELKMARYMVLGIGCLRVSKTEFKKKFNLDINEVHGGVINDLKKWNLIGEDHSWIWLTEIGKEYAASISKMFYSNSSKGILQGEKV